MSVEDLFQAYYDARRNKRNSTNALAFEIDYETKLFALYDDIISGRYEIGQSACFISFKPVQREIFAADFRDRIVHHFIYNYISPHFERLFIHDAYSCRIGKGTSYGIQRIDHFIRSCSQNYSRDCYVLKLDIRGYFMSMDRSILYAQIKKTVLRYQGDIPFNTKLLLGLIRQVIFHDPTENFRMSGGGQRDWVGLPKSKSLFFAEKNKGLPIGNLTSQLFGNVYLNAFDHFVKHRLGCKYYGRYVDDFIIVHSDRSYLERAIPVIRRYLKSTVDLDLHRNKIFLQPYTQGVAFLGVIIKPYRVYICNKTKAGLYEVLTKIPFARYAATADKNDIQSFVAGMNSYLGIMKNYDTYALRRNVLTKYLPGKADIHIAPKYDKITAL